MSVKCGHVCATCLCILLKIHHCDQVMHIVFVQFHEICSCTVYDVYVMCKALGLNSFDNHLPLTLITCSFSLCCFRVKICSVTGFLFYIVLYIMIHVACFSDDVIR